MNLAKRMAAGVPAPVFCLPCDGKRQSLRRLRRIAGVRLVDTPRHATVLVVAGDVVPQMAPAVRRIHDQLPEPRGVLCWNWPKGAEVFAAAPVVVQDGEAPGNDIARLHRDLVTGRRPSSPLFGPPENPVDWQGKGDYGQGGEGMMGGTPYGRSMAMTGNDLRDGLQLGSSRFSLGPFIAWMPPGLRISVMLQGDVVQQLACKAPPGFPFPRDVDPVFLRALTEPVPLAALETARARHHLQAVADLLYLLEMDGYGLQTLNLAATAAPGQSEKVHRLARKLRRTGLFLWTARGLGHLPPETVAGLGPLARAAGREEDARQTDPAYKDFDFAPLTQKKGDAGAICVQRLAEAAQALDLAGRAGDRRRDPGPPLEGPRGAMGEEKGSAWKALIEEQAAGMAWDNFVTWLVSLDLDASALPPAEDYAEEDTPSAGEAQGEDGHEEGGHGKGGPKDGESGDTEDAAENGEHSH